VSAANAVEAFPIALKIHTGSTIVSTRSDDLAIFNRLDVLPWLATFDRFTLIPPQDGGVKLHHVDVPT
jgi:hypothetical protein